jgi:hypothetical protein
LSSVALSSLIGTNENTSGVYNTHAGGDSAAAMPGLGDGRYPLMESPNKACDNNTNTKYLSFGLCETSNTTNNCGVDTGLYLTLERDASLVLGLQVCTAGDYVERDPLTVTLEGSNQTGIELTLGTSWTLIYRGASGLLLDLCRKDCGEIQYFPNSIWYTSYRFLIDSKRMTENSVQYSELQLFGK